MVPRATGPSNSISTLSGNALISLTVVSLLLSPRAE